LYVCVACNREVDAEDLRRRVSCPYCGAKVIIKKRPPIQREVLTD